MSEHELLLLLEDPLQLLVVRFLDLLLVVLELVDLCRQLDHLLLQLMGLNAAVVGWNWGDA